MTWTSLLTPTARHRARLGTSTPGSRFWYSSGCQRLTDGSVVGRGWTKQPVRRKSTSGWGESLGEV